MCFDSELCSDEWHLITDYAINGAAKPSTSMQAIWDSYLECLAVDKCKENTQYHPYLLREGNFEIPAMATTRCRWIHTVVLVIFRMLQDIVCMTGLN